MSTLTMPTRRFGRTELSMPVFSCGGMRYQHKWGDAVPDEIPADAQANLEATIQRALEVGINHIETARGYGSSEMQLGFLLPKLPREKMIIQTKVGPSEDPKIFLETFEKSMNYLQLDYVDLLSFHGINNAETLQWALKLLDGVRKLQRDGRVRFIGFSTHGSCAEITAAIETGEFDYLNLHWYFVNDLNWGAIEAAKKNDMGVFIISPSDKGGLLYNPPQKMVELCAPLSPMQFNDFYCLQRPEVHTLSIGAAKPTDFDDHLGALKYYDDIPNTIAPIEKRVRAEMESTLGADWCAHWFKNIPDHYEMPEGLNVMEILRLWTYAKSLDLVEWGKMRYNLLGNAGHWFPGQHVGKMDDAAWRDLGIKLQAHPLAARIPEVLRDAHSMLLAEEVKRQSESK